MPALTIRKNIKKKMKNYFSEIPEISMAFIFGSFAKGTARPDSDIDIAVYFKPKGKKIEYESENKYEIKHKIQEKLEEITKKDVDLLVLNNAYPTLIYDVFKNGKKIIIKDRLLYMKLHSKIFIEAIDFFKTVDEFWAIKQRSHSLSKIDRLLLIKHLDFLKSEIDERDYFKKITYKTYETDKHKRRDIEKWVQNIMNCTIEISKILLASNHKKIPSSYKQIIKSLGNLNKFKSETADNLSNYARLRNIIAHEYLDTVYEEIIEFVKNSREPYNYFINYIEKIIEE
ncbi:DUF86 domain-containing protein [Candidatus Woesearchaeota archaeon]|nr:DUF86 domain-containing protein [Candidatus Woesearchaeota archaeon]